MTLPLPNLDDRRWSDLVEDARALIPVYAPEWTDHNFHDPGITIIELLAWIAEMDLFELNQIPDHHKRKFLALLGIEALPPLPSRAVLAISGEGVADGLQLPAELIFSGRTQSGDERLVTTMKPLPVVPTTLRTIQLRDDSGVHDVTDRWRRGETIEPFGSAPSAGCELYFGFERPVPPSTELSLFVGIDGERASADERERIVSEAKSRCRACRRIGEERCRGRVRRHHPTCQCEHSALRHQGVRLEWVMYSKGRSGSSWQPLDGAAGTISDGTRALTLSGLIVVKPTLAMTATVVGNSESLYFLRARIAAGAYDAAPAIRDVKANATDVVQASPAGDVHWTIAKGTSAPDPSPVVGTHAAFDLVFDAKGQISSLSLADGDRAPRLLVLQYEAPKPDAPGSLAVEAVELAAGTGLPLEARRLVHAPIVMHGFQLWSLEGGGWQRWRIVADFDASGPADRDATVDAAGGWIRFGDGARGFAPPPAARLFALASVTNAADGNFAAGTIDTLVDCAHNRALVKDFDGLAKQITSKISVTESAGGAAAEPLAHAIGRAIESVNAVTRAVTLQDLETLALETPGTRLARAKAWANVHPDLPCFGAPGMVTVVIVPDLPVPRPSPSSGTRHLVATYLERRRTIGTRIEIAAPRYVEVAVRATVRAIGGADKAALVRSIADTLTAFFSPIEGGPDATGWPFGRDVFRAEILKVVRGVPGVDYVEQLGFVVDGCDCRESCGNVCIGPIQLVASGTHEIEVN